jgi:hypothetical protein
MTLRIGLILLLGIGTALLACAEPGWAASECTKFGKPSYTADRTVVFGTQTIKSKVFVRGEDEREEISHGAQSEVVITSPAGIKRFIPAAKVGMQIPPPPNGKSAQDRSRMREENAGANKRIMLDGKDKNGKWFLISDVLCRPDGVMLSRTSFIPMNGKVVEAKLTQDNIVVGAVDEKLFTPPSDIKFQTMAPPKGR